MTEEKLLSIYKEIKGKFDKEERSTGFTLTKIGVEQHEKHLKELEETLKRVLGRTLEVEHILDNSIRK
jgi:hypothetical protein